MKNQFKLALISLFLLFILTGSTVATATSYIQVTIKNGTASTQTNVTYTLPVSPTSLVSAGLLASNGLNENLQQGTSNSPVQIGNASGSNYTGFISSLPASGTVTQNIYLGLTGSEPLTSFQMMPSGITTPDTAALEPGSDFTFDESAFIDTSVSKVPGDVNPTNGAYIYKAGAVGLFLSAAQTLTAVVYNASGTNTEYPATPDLIEGVWDIYTGCTSVTQYNCVNSGDHSSYLGYFNHPVVPVTSKFTMGNYGPSTYWVPISASASVDFWCSNIAQCNGGSSVTITENITGSTNTCTQTLVTTWETCSIASIPITRATQASLNLTITSSNAGYNFTQEVANAKLIITSYNTRGTQTVSGVTTGYHTLEMTSGGTNLFLIIDGVSAHTACSPNCTVPNSTNTWNWFSGSSAVYIDSIKETLISTEKLWYQYNSLANSSVLTDRDGTANGSIFFAAPTCSGCTVSVSPIALLTSVSGSNNAGPNAISQGNTSIGKLSQTNGTTSGFFLDPLIQSIFNVPFCINASCSSTATIPTMLFYYLIGLVISIFAMIGAFNISHQNVFWTCTAVVSIGVLFTVLKVFPIFIPVSEALVSAVLVYLDGRAPFKSAG